MKNVNDLISELGNMSEDLRELPVAVIAENGLLLTPVIRCECEPYHESPLTCVRPTRVVITWQG